MAIRLDAHRDEFHRDQQWHKPVRVATTAPITIATGLNAGDTLDGITLAAGDRVLVKDQSSGAQNGIYVVSASPVRAYDMLAGIQALGAVVKVLVGTANAGTYWECSNTTLPMLGTTALTWQAFSGGGSGSSTDPHIVLFLDHGDVGATETIDQSAAGAHLITLDTNCTLTFTGAVSTVGGDPVECSFGLYVEQDETGGWDVTWPASVIWPDETEPTLDTTPGSVEVLAFYTLDGGTVWYGKHRDVSPVDPGQPEITIEDEGTPIVVAPTTIGFTGDGVEATVVGTDVTVTIPGSGNGIGPILISDTPSTPLIFADLVQNEDQDDLVYADV